MKTYEIVYHYGDTRQVTEHATLEQVMQGLPFYNTDVKNAFEQDLLDNGVAYYGWYTVKGMDV